MNVPTDPREFEDPFLFAALDDAGNVVAICARGNADAVQDFMREARRDKLEVRVIGRQEGLDAMIRDAGLNPSGAEVA